jgi:glycosyltransferase 2 family protein
MELKIFKHAKKFLPIIGLILFTYVIYSLDLQDIKEAFLAVKPVFIVLSLCITIPRALIRNYAWRLIQKEQKIKLSYFKSLKILLIGLFYGCITPGYTGQMVRIPYMKEKTGEPYGKLFINTFMETAVHTSSLYIMLLFGALLISTSLPQVFYGVIIWVVTFFVFILFFVNKNRGEKILGFLIKYFVPKKAKNILNDFVGTFYEDFPKIRNLFFPFLLGITTWILIFSQYYILVIALNLEIPYLHFLLLFTVANVISFIPISFGGIGTREFAAVFIFTTLYDVGGAEVFVVSLLGFLITDMSMGVAGFFASLTEVKPKKTF